MQNRNLFCFNSISKRTQNLLVREVYFSITLNIHDGIYGKKWVKLSLIDIRHAPFESYHENLQVTKKADEQKKVTQLTPKSNFLNRALDSKTIYFFFSYKVEGNKIEGNRVR